MALFVLKCAFSQNEWRSNEGKLLNARAFAGSVSVNDKIYIIGGVVNPYTSSNRNTDVVEEYNPSTKSCSIKAGRLPTMRHSFGLATDNKNLIYVVGGADMNSNYHSALEVYNVEKDEWVKLANMPTTRQQTCAALIGDSLYVIGGDNSVQNPMTKYCFEVYVVSQNRWIKKTNMETAVRNGCAVVFNSKVYVIGGHEPNGNVVLEYNPPNGKWIKKTNMPTPRTDLAVEVLNGKIYAIGGHPGIPAVEEYDPSTDSWKKMANMPTGRCFHSSAVANNRIFILGGANTQHSNQPTNFKTIESFMPNDFTGHSSLLKPPANMNIFPNPCEGFIQIENTGSTTYNYKLVDRKGVLLASENKVDEASYLINTQQFSPGIYFCLIDQNEKKYTYKLCKR